MRDIKSLGDLKEGDPVVIFSRSIEKEIFLGFIIQNSETVKVQLYKSKRQVEFNIPGYILRSYTYAEKYVSIHSDPETYMSDAYEFILGSSGKLNGSNFGFYLKIKEFEKIYENSRRS